MLLWLHLLAVAVLQQCSATSHICSYLEYNTLRLYNPNANASIDGGMVQVCSSGTWRAVCDYRFDCTAEGRAACKQLGYGGTNLRVVVMSNSATLYGPWSYYSSRYYSCSTSSSSLTSCSSSYSSYRCNYDDHAGLWCLTVPPRVPQCTNGAVRLVGGQSPREGRLEYCYHGAWSQFCSSFHIEEATVACKQLGFTNLTGATIFTDKRFGIVSNFSLFSSISCSSNAVENNLSSCTLLSHTCGIRCSTFYGIRCYESNSDGCTEGTVRLANSTIENEGRIEVCRQGTWGPICGAGVVEAYFACRALGFDAAPQQHYSNSEYGDSDRPFSYCITKCYGWEKTILDCTMGNRLSCSRSQAAAVICRDGCTNGAVRLVGGSDAGEGTLEVCYDQTWRLVASSQWTPEDSQVVCRQLGYPSQGAVSHINSPFLKSKRSILYSGVQCTGSEAKLMDCPSNRVSYETGKSLLSHVNIAGVSCRVPIITSSAVTCNPPPSPSPPPSCPTMECPTISCPRQPATTLLLTTCPSSTPLPPATSSMLMSTPQKLSSSRNTALQKQSTPNVMTSSLWVLSPSASRYLALQEHSTTEVPPLPTTSTAATLHHTPTTVVPLVTSGGVSLSTQVKILPTVDAVGQEECMSYFNTLIILCVLYAVTVGLLVVGLCVMVYKNGRMRGRIKQHTLTVASSAATNPLYTPAANVYKESTKDTKDES